MLLLFCVVAGATLDCRAVAGAVPPFDAELVTRRVDRMEQSMLRLEAKLGQVLDKMIKLQALPGEWREPPPMHLGKPQGR